ncbi:hypothetical protein [Nocardia sp. XZ_19_369]|uniref:hypothetical protein n=1 Tax=Nocardia sp. XZ_19_369 TaxID=2769487 RepID=UPI00188F6C57|nr:hypothetical protein [Nocardia sp. XZ_19_369]
MMFESCHTPNEVAHVYRRKFGLPVELFDRRAFIATGDTVGAVLMPPPLGLRVKKAFSDEVSVPIIRHFPRGGHWIFLASTRGRVRNRAVAELMRHDGTVLSPRTRVWLPMTDAGIEWTWFSPPHPGAVLPTLPLVMHTALAVIDQDEMSSSPALKR